MSNRRNLDDCKVGELRRLCTLGVVDKGRKADMISDLREKLEGGAIVLGHIDVAGRAQRLEMTPEDQAEQAGSRLLSGRGDSEAAMRLLVDIDTQETDIHPRMRARLEAMAVWARLRRGWDDLNNEEFDGVRACLTQLGSDKLPPREEKSRLALTRALPGAERRAARNAQDDKDRELHAKRQPRIPKALRMTLR